MSQWLSWIQVLNCLKMSTISHKFTSHVMCSCLYLSLSLVFDQVMSPHHSDQMSQRSQVSWVARWGSSQSVFVIVFVIVIVIVFVFVIRCLFCLCLRCCCLCCRCLRCRCLLCRCLRCHFFRCRCLRSCCIHCRCLLCYRCLCCRCRSLKSHSLCQNSKVALTHSLTHCSALTEWLRSGIELPGQLKMTNMRYGPERSEGVWNQELSQ